MCGGPEQLNSTPPASSSTQESESLTKAMDHPIETIVSENSFSELLELAADNDLEGFKNSVLDDPCKIDEVGLWYARQTAQRRTVLLHRTPLMVASIYGSVEILNFILSLSKEDINRSCDSDKSTALHCAASGGSAKAVDVVKSLLLAGADPDATDCHGRRPFDVIASAPNLKAALKEMLRSETDVLQVSDVVPNSPPLSSSLENGSMWSPSGKKEYPIDPSIPDIRNSIYASDEFRMFSFKIRPCSRSYTHDWTECPFVHPGENARRRDPKKFHYSCVPCPDHRKAPCRRGDSCEYAHGVFESLLHPAQYRTRICKDGVSCARRVCFFAHKPEELRPLYLSTGSAVPSPPHSAIEMASRNPLSPPPFTPPMSPGNGGSQASVPWPQQNIPTLQLPGNHLQISRLRSSLNARDVQMSLNDFSCFSPNRSLRSNDLGEVMSPRYSDQFVSSPVFSPSQKLAFINQQSKREFMLSPVKTTHMFSPKNVEHPLQGIDPISPMRSRASSLANRENQMRSLSSRDLGSNLSRDAVHNLPGDLETSDFVGSPVNCWSQWESPIKKADWSVQGDELDRLRKSFSTGHNTMDPEVSGVRSAAKELPSDIMAMANSFSIECPNTKPNDQVVALA